MVRRGGWGGGVGLGPPHQTSSALSVFVLSSSLPGFEKATPISEIHVFDPRSYFKKMSA